MVGLGAMVVAARGLVGAVIDEQVRLLIKQRFDIEHPTIQIEHRQDAPKAKLIL